MADFDYDPPGAVAARFLNGDKFVRGIRGPIGSGKSVTCCVELLRRALQQQPSPVDKKRYTRWAVVRNTNPQLKTTTIKTWLEWFPEETFGKFNWSPPYTHHIQIEDIDMEVVFIALDKPVDIRKLLSMDLTGVWVNEAREVDKEIIDGCTMRAGRYPAMKHGGATWYGVIMDTNAPPDQHWWPVMSGDAPIPEWITEEESRQLVKPDDWEFYNQPPGMIEVKDQHGDVTGYVSNPEAENIKNLAPDYYAKVITGKTKGWIDVYIMNRLGSSTSGKPVYPQWNDAVHIADSLLPNPAIPLYLGLDFGLTPAAVIAQRSYTGQWRIFREIVTDNTTIERFSSILRQVLSEFMAQYSITSRAIKIWGDPSGAYRDSNKGNTAYEILRKNGIRAVPAPIPNNDPAVRIEAVASVLTRMIDGAPGLMIDKQCRVLIAGFRNDYHYKRMNVTGEPKFSDTPDKNRYSHVHDAFQYLMIGAGEGRAVVYGNTKREVVQAQHTWNPLDFRQRPKSATNSGRGRR